MQIHIQTKNMEAVEGLQEYIEKRLAHIEKFLKQKDVAVHIEVSKTTNHHKNGDVYKAEVIIGSGDSKFFATTETDDVYKAIDTVKDEIVRKLTTSKDRMRTLFKRGALSVKKMMNLLRRFIIL